MDDECCGTCKFFTIEFTDNGDATEIGDETTDVGECIRFPPTVSAPFTKPFPEPHEVATATRFPILSYVRVCGEFKLKGRK